MLGTRVIQIYARILTIDSHTKSESSLNFGCDYNDYVFIGSKS